MAIVVDPSLDPRIVTVPITDGVSITIQSLHDQIRDWEDRQDSLAYPRLVLSSGKEDLGGGVAVGITSTLQNTQVEFEGRTTVSQAGTVTTPDAAGETLIDSGATFEANNVERGDLIINFTDLSLTVVVRVESEQELITKPLLGGGDDQWDSSDVYRIYDVVRCNISGGNLGAIDTAGDAIDPISPTVNTQIVRASSSSATLLEAAESTSDANLKYLIESQRPGHAATGDIFYWSPTDGNDSNDGTTPALATLTFAAAYALTADSNNDVVMAIADAIGTTTVVTEQIVLDKDFTYLRGPGENFQIAPVTDVLPVSITAQGAEFSGFRVVGLAGSGTTNAITVSNRNVLLSSLLIETAGDQGIEFNSDSSTSIVDTVVINDSESNGILINHPCKEIIVMNSKFDSNGQNVASSGIQLLSNVAPTTRLNSITGNQFTNNSAYGVDIGSGVVRTILGQDNIFGENTLGDILDTGTATIEQTWKTVEDTKLIVGDNQALILSG